MSAHLQWGRTEQTQGKQFKINDCRRAQTRHYAVGTRPLSIVNFSYTSRIKSKGVHRFSYVSTEVLTSASKPGKIK